MYTALFDEFLASNDTFRAYEDSKLLFSSTKDRLLPLLEYISRFAPHQRQVVIFDRIMGNAAALLSVKINCREVYSPLGSQLGIKTLEKYGIGYHISEVVPCIQKASGEGMCPMEELSLDKEPEEFYEAMKNIIKQGAG